MFFGDAELERLTGLGLGREARNMAFAPSSLKNLRGGRRTGLGETLGGCSRW